MRIRKRDSQAHQRLRQLVARDKNVLRFQIPGLQTVCQRTRRNAALLGTLDKPPRRRNHKRAFATRWFKQTQ